MISDAGKRVHTCMMCRHYGDDNMCPLTMCLKCLFNSIPGETCISPEKCRKGQVHKMNACDVFDARQWDG